MRRIGLLVLTGAVAVASLVGCVAVNARPASGGGAQATTCVVVDPIWVDNQQLTDRYQVCLPV